MVSQLTSTDRIEWRIKKGLSLFGGKTVILNNQINKKNHTLMTSNLVPLL